MLHELLSNFNARISYKRLNSSEAKLLIPLAYFNHQAQIIALDVGNLYDNTHLRLVYKITHFSTQDHGVILKNCVMITQEPKKLLSSSVMLKNNAYITKLVENCI